MDSPSANINRANVITEFDKQAERASRPRSVKHYWLWLRHRPRVLIGGVIIVAIVSMAILAPVIAPYNPVAPIFIGLQGPSAEHLLGTDELGRDTLSRVIHGAKVSLQVGLVAVAIAFFVGVTLGLLSGYWRGKVDAVVMRVMDGLLSFPALVLALGIGAMLGPGIHSVMIAVGVVYTPNFARVARAQTLSVGEREFVQAARAVGAGPWRIMLRHIWPNITAPIIVQASLSIATAIIIEASLSYLGLGQQPPTPTWGQMLRIGYGYLETLPWLSIAPGAAIFVTVLGFNLLGDGIRDALDPRLRRTLMIGR